MRKILTIILASMFIFVAPVNAGEASCIVVPNPVTWGTDFHIEYEGLKGNIYYWVKMNQSTEHFGHHPDGFFVTEADGSGTYIQPNVWTDPREALELGNVKVRFVTMALRDTGTPELTGKGPSASCQFDVV